jgi:hypothetical protein
MTLEELEKRITTLEDFEEIKKLHKECVYCLANRKRDDLLDCFAEDGTADIDTYGLRKGKKEIEDLVKNEFDKLPKATGRPVGQPVISVEGDKAKGHFVLYTLPYGPSSTWRQGRCDHEYVKIDGKWKFSLVKFRRWSAQPE